MIFRFLTVAVGLPGCLLLSACHRPVPSAVAAAPVSARVLRFGSGGGFAGTSTTYSLSADGRFERRRGSLADTTQATAQLPAPAPEVVAKCFREFDALPADSLTLRQPGNMYYFLEGKTAAGRPVSLTWGATGVAVPRAAQALYRELVALVPPSK